MTPETETNLRAYARRVARARAVEARAWSTLRNLMREAKETEKATLPGIAGIMTEEGLPMTKARVYQLITGRRSTRVLKSIQDHASKSAESESNGESVVAESV